MKKKLQKLVHSPAVLTIGVGLLLLVVTAVATNAMPSTLGQMSEDPGVIENPGVDPAARHRSCSQECSMQLETCEQTKNKKRETCWLEYKSCKYICDSKDCQKKSEDSKKKCEDRAFATLRDCYKKAKDDEVIKAKCNTEYSRDYQRCNGVACSSLTSCINEKIK